MGVATGLVQSSSCRVDPHRSSSMSGAADPAALKKRGHSWRPEREVHLYVQVRIHGVVQPMLVPLMLQYVTACDRSFLFKRYRRCFVGSDAVAFFVKRGFARSVEEAVALGNSLLKAGVFRHVKGEYLFKNGNYFYRFAAHEDYCKEDDKHIMRGSRMMSVACNSFLSSLPAKRMEIGPMFSDVTASDRSSTEGQSVSRDYYSYEESDIKVDIGIQIGSRRFPNLVSNFIQAVGLVGTNFWNGNTYNKSFLGSEAVQWMLDKEYANSVKECIKIGSAMMTSGVFHPLASSDYGFDCNMLPYRFTADVDTTKALRKGALKDKLLKYLMGINRESKGNIINPSPWFEHSLSNVTEDGKVAERRRGRGASEQFEKPPPNLLSRPVSEYREKSAFPDPVEQFPRRGGSSPGVKTINRTRQISDLTEEERVASSAVTVYRREERTAT